MKFEVEKFADTAELFTKRGPSLFFPIDREYIANIISELLTQVASAANYSVGWTGKRFTIMQKGELLSKSNFENVDALRSGFPDLYKVLTLVNFAKIKHFQGQPPATQM